jgi:alkyldihydroxyacetonephosphate synthase
MSERQRSFWGWGWADKFPDDSARKAIAEQVGGLFGLSGLELQSPPRIEHIKLPEPREVMQAPFCSTDRLERASHCYGKGFIDIVRGFRGDFCAAPDFVARPRTEDEIGEVLEWCERRKVAAIPFGGGTSVVGGVEASIGSGYNGAVSLDVGALSRVVEIDDVSRAARIQAGALGPLLEAQLGEKGFTLRHFPQSFEFSTLGGWIATRAGGHFATLYTHIDDLVESTRTITPRGVMETRRLPASGAGPNPDRLVLGSEGILGVITEAWMRIQQRPQWRLTASVHFASFPAAMSAVRQLSQSGLHPSNCRLLDEQEALLNRVAMDGSAVVVVAFESSDHPLVPWMDRALAITSAHGGRCPDGPVSRSEGKKGGGGGAAASWRSAFMEAPYLQNALLSVGVMADTFETACTWNRFEELHGAVTTAVRDTLQRVCGGGVVACRLTHLYPDGPAPYYTFIGPARRGAEIEQWSEVKRAASDALAAKGATITHHHAVGRVHRPWYDRERPQQFAEMLRAAKRTVDPAGILNPGVLIDPST